MSNVANRQTNGQNVYRIDAHWSYKSSQKKKQTFILNNDTWDNPKFCSWSTLNFPPSLLIFSNGGWGLFSLFLFLKKVIKMLSLLHLNSSSQESSFQKPR